MSDAQETLQFLCWKFATDGDRFYPPKETANECCEELDTDDEYVKGLENGQHGRAWGEAVNFFEKLRVRGYDPVSLAQQEQADLRGRSEAYSEELSWEWLADSHYQGEVTVEDD